MTTDRISVIIPAYNASRFIAACVRSALSGGVEPLEVIVVDDGSTDDTAAIVEALAQRYPGVVRLVRALVNGGPARARNLGAAAARGDYYFFVDSDTELLQDTLKNFLRRIRQADAVSGIYHPEPLSPGLTARHKAHLLAYLFERDGVFEHDVFISSSAGIRADVFKAVGGFNERLPWGLDVENEEFGHRISARYRMLTDPSTNVRHHFPGFRKLTVTYFRRVSLWMEFFLGHRRFERGGSATRRVGLSTAALAAALATLPLMWVSPMLWPLPALFFAWYLTGYGGYFAYVARRRPSFLPAAFVLNGWFSLVLAAGAAYGVLRVLTGTARVSDLARKSQSTLP
jgi:glycosyltransferase involved in cell wall biosynthesis